MGGGARVLPALAHHALTCGPRRSPSPRSASSACTASAIELRDLDQTVIGNPAYDLVRLVLSQDPELLPEPIGVVMRTALRRNWSALREERLDDRARFPLGKKFWPLGEDERAAVEALVSQEALRKLVTKLDGRDDDAPIELVDAEYWVKGCSSKAHAERVVTGARQIAPALGERMVASSVLEHSVFVRELLPQDLKVELDELSADEGRAVARYLGVVVGRAHAWQLSLAERASWLAELAGHRTKNIDAPTWLWQAVIRLVADHEHAYLEHCRRYALDVSRRELEASAAS